MDGINIAEPYQKIFDSDLFFEFKIKKMALPEYTGKIFHLLTSYCFT